MEETPQGSNNAGNVVGWIERIVQIVKKYGLQQIFMSFLVLFIAIMVGIFAFNPNEALKRIEKAQNKAHNEAVMKRIKNVPKIREGLMNFKDEIKSDRTFILEYRNVRLSHYPLASYIFNNNFWFGSIDELKEIDEELALRLQKEDVMYFGMMMMYGEYNPLGTIGLVYSDEYHVPTKIEIKKAMFKYSSIIAPLLNNEH